MTTPDALNLLFLTLGTLHPRVKKYNYNNNKNNNNNNNNKNKNNNHTIFPLPGPNGAPKRLKSSGLIVEKPSSELVRCSLLK